MAESLTEHQYGDRNVRVLVPPGYIESRRDAYPLVLLHDGQNLFAQGSTAPGGGSWRVDLAVPPLIATGRIPPVVVAGIDHAGDGRIGEFAPTPAGKLGRWRRQRRTRGSSSPTSCRAFPPTTTCEPILTASRLGGSSMGGLVTLWMAILFPGFFGRLIVMSPSLWWDRRVVLRHLRKHEIEPLPRIWLDAGRREGAVVTRDARELHKLLRRQSRSEVRYVEDPQRRSLGGQLGPASAGRARVDVEEHWVIG